MVSIPPPGPERDRAVAEAMGIVETGLTDEEWQRRWREHGGSYPGAPNSTYKGYLRSPDYKRVVWCGPEYSTDDATFVHECLPWLRSKGVAGIVSWDVEGNFRFQGLRGPPVAVGKTFADAGTAFILKAKEAGLV